MFQSPRRTPWRKNVATVASWLTDRFLLGRASALLFVRFEAEMSEADALKAAREQYEYWCGQYIDAQASGDLERIVLCRKFVDQCELIVSALDGTGDA